MTVFRVSFVRFNCAAFLLGSFGLALISGCGDPAPVTAEKSKFQVAGEEEESPAKDGDPPKASGKSGTGEFPSVAGDPFSQKKSPRAKPEPGAEDPGKAAEPPEVVEDTNDYGASPQYPLPSGGAQEVVDFLQDLNAKTPRGSGAWLGA